MFRILFSLVLFACLTGQAQRDPLLATHNMLVFGSKVIYMAHLPAFSMVPHRFQGIYEVTFGEENDAKYRTDKAKSGKPLYGINPRGTFRMPDVIEDFSFAGGLVAGHPEAGLLPIFLVKVKILRVIHFHGFDQVKKRPKELTYFTVGKKGSDELFLVHWLTTPTVLPNQKDQFDHIVSVVAKDDSGKAVGIFEKSWITFPGRSDKFSERLNLPEEDIESYQGIALSTRSSETLFFKVVRSIRLHTGGDVTVRQ